MFDNQGVANTLPNSQSTEGLTVYDTTGEKVGTVREDNVQGGYLDVQKGWLFPKDIYVPRSAVSNIDANGVYLSLYKDDLQNQNWDAPPMSNATTSDQTATMTGAGYTTDTTTGAGNTMDTSTGAGYTTDTMTGVGNTTTNQNAVATDSDQIRVPVREEELVAGKQQEEVGRVHLHKEVVEEQETVNVPLRRERVTVERVPVTGDASIDDGQDAFTERDIDVPVMGEEAVVGKRTVVAEEVRLHKDIVTEQQQVSDTVRKERVIVDDVDEGGTTRR